MSIHPGYSGQKFMPEAVDRIRRLRAALPARRLHPGRRRDRPRDDRPRVRGGRALLVAGSAIFGREDLTRPTGAFCRTFRDPTSGRSSSPSGVAARRATIRSSARSSSATARSRGGLVRARGSPPRRGLALEQAGETARGATLYVTLEPCSHHGRRLPAPTRWWPPESRGLLSAPATRIRSSMVAGSSASRRPASRSSSRPLRRAPAERGLASVEEPRPPLSSTRRR